MQFARALALWQIQTFCRIYYRKSLLLNGKQEQYETFSDHKNLPLLLQTYKPYEIVSFMSKQNGRKLREDTEKYTFLRIRDLFNLLNRYAGHVRTQKIRQATLTMLGTRIPFYYLALGPRTMHFLVSIEILSRRLLCSFQPISDKMQRRKRLGLATIVQSVAD